MPLPKPVLDARSFDQLSDEARSLLPEVAPQWTDHNISNTGITLSELLAWLCEMDLYRLDRTTDEAIRGFLRLVGVEPLPAQVAHAVLVVGTAAELALPAELQLFAPGTSSPQAPADIVFQTIEPVLLSPARLMRVIAGDGSDVTGRNLAGDDPYLPFGGAAGHDAALYLGFDIALAGAGGIVSLYAWTPQPERDASVRRRLVTEHRDAERERDETCAPTLRELPPWWLHYQVRTRWEYFSAAGDWKPLPGLVDHTRALTLSGPIRFEAPADHGVGGGPDAGLHWLRCRIATTGFECPARLARIALNAVEAAHAADAAVVLGTSRGHAHERYPVKPEPIVAGSTRMTATVGAQTQLDWREVRWWDLSGAHDRHYRLDDERNAIELGDGRRGDVAGAGTQLELRFRVGGGTSGNLPAGSLGAWLDNAHNHDVLPGWSAIAPTLPLQQPFASFGGSAAESLKAAVARAIEITRTGTVALTLDDFERAALDTPGVPVARAYAIADREPTLPCFRAGGDLTVVTVPDCDGPRPLPSDGMRAAVGRHLERRRSPATRLHIIAPTYYEVSVVARLHALPGIDRKRLRDEAGAAIDAFLHPLRGGPDGTGWRAGRAVHRSEVSALLQALPGVANVSGLGLRGERDDEPRCGNLPLCDEQLPAPGRHCLTVIAVPALRILDRSKPHECP